MSETFNTDPVRFLKNGRINIGGKIYYGVVNGDPVNVMGDRIDIFANRALTTALPNPISTGSDGRTAVNGVPAKVWLGVRHSLFELDNKNVEQFQDLDRGETPGTGAPIKLTNVQGTNAITAEGDPPFPEFIDGQIYILGKKNGDNTGDMTLSVTGTTPTLVPIKKNFNQEIQAGGVKENQQLELIFNSTGPIFELQSPAQYLTNAGPLAVTVFTADGTWTRNSKTVKAEITCIGGGGGGAGAGPTSGAGGGGSGGTSLAFVTSFTGPSDSVVVGDGGTGAAAQNGGGNGDSTNVGTLCKANEGKGAATGGGGGAGASATDAIGDLITLGAGGFNVCVNGDTQSAGGSGGGSSQGAGGRGGLGGNGIGGAGTPFGAGGGGGGATAGAGGNGAKGVVIIREY